VATFFSFEDTIFRLAGDGMRKTPADLKRSIGQNMVPENSFSEDLPLNILKI
jgi:hypothetical protein